MAYLRKGTAFYPSTVTSGTLGSGVTFPTGHILQVLSTHKNTVFSQTSSEVTGGTWGDITGLTVAITPETGNKVLVNVSLSISLANASYAFLVRLYRTNSGGSAVINGGAAAGVREPSVAKMYTSSTSQIDNINMTYLDSPPAGASTYKMEWQGETGTEFYLNRGGTEANSTDSGRYASNITVMEVQV